MISEHEISAGIEGLLQHVLTEIDAQKQPTELASARLARLDEQAHVVPILGQFEWRKALEQRYHGRQRSAHTPSIACASCRSGDFRATLRDDGFVVDVPRLL